jgi:hypothetical protein
MSIPKRSRRVRAPRDGGDNEEEDRSLGGMDPAYLNGVPQVWTVV